MTPIRVICHRVDGGKSMISIMIPEGRLEEPNLDDLVLEMASELMSQSGKADDIIYYEIQERRK